MKASIGDLVHIRFLDHVESSQPMKPIEFEVFGRLIRSEKDFCVVASWMETDGTLDENTKSFTIVNSTITKARRLR